MAAPDWLAALEPRAPDVVAVLRQLHRLRAATGDG
jgi:hypothetical protein